MEEKRVWGIHATDGRMFLDKKMIAIGWGEMGDLSLIEPSREAFKEKYQKTYPDGRVQGIPTTAGMLYRFIHEMRAGDYVIFPSKFNREINIGVIESEYTYLQDEKTALHTRNVKWLKHLPRTAFSQGALYEAGTALTLFSVKNYADEYLSALSQKGKKIEIASDDQDAVAKNAEDIVDNTTDFILKELSKNLKGYALEEFVADLLKAMGYRTILSPHGGDSGIDITAYKDELPPRILVQVKSGDGDINESTIQSLKGAMREGDYGLFITLSDYTKNARRYLDNTPTIRGINGTDLVELILKYYADLSKTYQRIIPLRKVYIPIVAL